MDDQQFDDLLKSKLESLSPPYKEEAWKSLDYRLDLLAPLPWYSRWKSLLIAGSLGVITLLNIGLLYKVDNEQDQLRQLVALLNVDKTDTVYLTTESYLSTSFLTSADRSRQLGSDAANNDFDLLDPWSVYKIRAIAGSNQIAKPYEVLPVPQLLTSAADVQSPLIAAGDITRLQSLDPFDQQYSLSTPAGDDMYVRVVIPPSKKKWDHPLDPRIGLAVGYLIPDPDLGERFVSSRQSLLIETPVRGNFHLMSGLSLQHFTYKLDDVDDNNFEPASLQRYPDFGSFNTSPDEIKVENRMLQIPLYFRYYKPLNHSWSVFAGGGPTVDILLNQKFTYSFLEIRNEQLVKFDEVRESNDVSISLGSIAGNIGVEHYFSRRLSAQMELNYQFGLGNIGVEDRTFNSFAVSGGLFYKLNNSRKR